LAKCDIENAYRNLPLASTDHHLSGFKWNKLFYYDKCLPIGRSSSCQIFEQISTAIQWIGKNYMPSGLIFAQTKEDCKYYLEQFLDICGEIGIPMAPNKTVGPEKVLTFLGIEGIELDTENQVARLPDDKLQNCLFMIKDFLYRKKVTLKELQSIGGLLNFACRVVLPGRAFLRRLFDLSRGLQKPHHRVKLKGGCKEDLKVWEEFLHQFNGTCFFLDEIYLASEKLKLFTDASGSIGFCAVCETSWFNGTWNIDGKWRI